MKENNKEIKISYWAAHLTTVVSVTLVLLLVEIVAMIWLGAEGETRRLKEKIELSAVLGDSVSNAQAAVLGKEIAAKPYAQGVRVITKEEALKNWTADTGEDLQALFGVNPLSPEITFSVKADYASAAELKRIASQLEAMPEVEAVSSPDAEMVDTMNENIARLSLGLAIVAAIMLIISFVLINNTVRLTIYSRRFSIHTMQLVGATDGFIRRPVVTSNLLAGLVAGLLAVALLAIGVLAADKSGMLSMATLIDWQMYICLGVAILALGMALCALAAWLAANKYLRKDYDQLFR